MLVRAFPGMEGPWQVGAGEVPRWSPRGDRLFYRSGNDMMEVELETDPELRFETPLRLFTLESSPADLGEAATFEVRSDGETFLMVRPVEPPPGLVVVQNWLDAIE